jgi:hypothetical protein
MALFLASPLTAQISPDPVSQQGAVASDGKSNTNTATAGLFNEDRDLYLGTTGIKDLVEGGKKNKNLIFVNVFSPVFFGGDSGTDSFGRDYPYFDAGAGLLYRLHWFGLAFSYGIDQKNITEGKNAGKETAFDPNTGAAVSTTDTNKSTVQNKVEDFFLINAAFGNKIWGISNKLRIDTAYEEGYLQGNPSTSTITNPGAVTENLRYTRGRTSLGGFRNSLEVGINPDITERSQLFPWVKTTINLSYYDNSETGYGRETLRSDALAGRLFEEKHSEETVHGVFGFGFGLAGGLTLTLNEVFSFSPDVSYAMNIPLRNNRYTDSNGGAALIRGYGKTTHDYTFVNNGTYLPNTAEKPIHTSETDTRSAALYTVSEVDQNINMGLRLDAHFDRLNLAFKYSPRIRIYSDSVNTGFEQKTLKTETYGTDQAKSYRITTISNAGTTFSSTDKTVWDNTFYIGAQFWVKPDRFRINAGSTFNTTVGAWETNDTRTVTNGYNTVKKDYFDGHEDDTTGLKTEYVVVSSTVAEDQLFTVSGKVDPIRYGLGFTFFFNEHLDFDFLLGNQSGKGDDWLKLLLPATWALQINIRY